MDFFLDLRETLVRVFGHLLGNEFGYLRYSVVVYDDVVVVVFLRLDKSFGNIIANRLAVNGRLGNCGNHVDDRSRNFICNFIGVELGQVI